MREGGQRHSSAALPPGKNRGTQYRGDCVGVRAQGAENLGSTGFRSPDGDPVALRYPGPQIKRTIGRVSLDVPVHCPRFTRC
jgi:hypothetical protein